MLKRTLALAIAVDTRNTDRGLGAAAGGGDPPVGRTRGSRDGAAVGCLGQPALAGPDLGRARHDRGRWRPGDGHQEDGNLQRRHLLHREGVVQAVELPGYRDGRHRRPARNGVVGRPANAHIAMTPDRILVGKTFGF